jgi:molybdate transport system substrate-binding protein
MWRRVGPSAYATLRHMCPSRTVPLALLAVLALCAACGGGSVDTGGRPTLTVSAASSLQSAFDAYAKRFPQADVKAQFAGSDELAAQITQGVRPDVYAAANTSLPQQLHAKGLVGKPRVFAGNELVLAVPAGGARVHGLGDLAAPGVTIATGAGSVPVGAYTREVLDRLGAAQERGILANVRSREPDVKGVVGKIAQGAVDAGFVYRSDVRAADGRLRAIALPARLRPKVAYGVAVVTGARQPALARRFVDGLVRGDGQQALQAAGFLPPPQ